MTSQGHFKAKVIFQLINSKIIPKIPEENVWKVMNSPFDRYRGLQAKKQGHVKFRGWVILNSAVKDNVGLKMTFEGQNLVSQNDCTVR